MKVPTKKDILALLTSSDSRPMRIKEIQKSLALEKDQRRELKRLLRTMMEKGEIRKIKGGKYLFNNRNNSVKKNVKVDADVGEKSKAKKETKRQRRAAELRVGLRVVGKLVKRKGKFFVIPRKDEFARIHVTTSKGNRYKSGLLVFVELLKEFRKRKKRYREYSGRIVRVLGKAGDPEVERKSILYEFDLPLRFPKIVERDAQKIADMDFREALRDRVDLRDRLTFTIDNDDAKDFDDAVSIEKMKTGYKLWVSIADVSFFVKRGSLIDKEALKRGTSFYLPNMVIPMLPNVLSDHLCSLVPHEDRLTKTVEIDFSDKGEVTDYKIYDSVIRSDERLTYSWVSEVLSKRGKPPKKYRDIVNSLRIMKSLYQKLKKRRIEKGELDFDIPDVQLVRDENGNIVNIIKAERTIAHGIIEEFMIAANSVVGSFFSKREGPSIYRIHEPPDRLSILELKKSLRQLGYELDIGREIRPKEIQRVIVESQNRQDKRSISFLILRSLKKAVYSTDEVEHFGLAIENYTHFTSPIRRYPDLVAHRIVNFLLGDSPEPYKPSELQNISEHCSKMERLADDAEREAIDLERAIFMKSHVGEVFSGTVISILPFGMFVELKEFFVEGFVSRVSMRKKRKVFKLGEDVKVKVVDSDIERRRVTLDLV